MTAMKLMLISTNVHSMSRKDNDALTLVEDTLKSSTFLSSLTLPFTSVYIDHKSNLDITLQDPSGVKLVEKNHGQKSKLFSCHFGKEKEFDATKALDNSFIVQSRIENNSSFFTPDRISNRNLSLNCPSKNKRNTLTEYSSSTEKNKERRTMLELNDTQLYGYHGFKSDNNFVQVNTDYIRPIGSTASNLQLVPRKRFNRYSTVHLEDIQEVKSQDEKSSYTDTRNNYSF